MVYVKLRGNNWWMFDTERNEERRATRNAVETGTRVLAYEQRRMPDGVCCLAVCHMPTREGSCPLEISFSYADIPFKGYKINLALGKRKNDLVLLTWMPVEGIGMRLGFDFPADMRGVKDAYGRLPLQFDRRYRLMELPTQGDIACFKEEAIPTVQRHLEGGGKLFLKYEWLGGVQWRAFPTLADEWTANEATLHTLRRRALL